MLRENVTFNIKYVLHSLLYKVHVNICTAVPWKPLVATTRSSTLRRPSPRRDLRGSTRREMMRSAPTSPRNDTSFRDGQGWLLDHLPTWRPRGVTTGHNPARWRGSVRPPTLSTGALWRPPAPPSSTSDSPQTPGRRGSLDTRPPSPAASLPKRGLSQATGTRCFINIFPPASPRSTLYDHHLESPTANILKQSINYVDESTICSTKYYIREMSNYIYNINLPLGKTHIFFLSFLEVGPLRGGGG